MVGNDNYKNGDHIKRAGPAELVPALSLFGKKNSCAALFG
jgi:hypothetical protein